MAAQSTERKEPIVATSHFDQFLSEATIPDPGTDLSLGGDTLYGLYTSWCFLKGLVPKEDSSFRAAMRRAGIDINDTRLRMTGPAAADYILASYPAMA